MERRRSPIVETRGQQRIFHSGGASALWICLIVGSGILVVLVVRAGVLVQGLQEGESWFLVLGLLLR